MKTYFLIALVMLLVSAAFAEKEVGSLVKELLVSDAEGLETCVDDCNPFFQPICELIKGNVENLSSCRNLLCDCCCA